MQGVQQTCWARTMRSLAIVPVDCATSSARPPAGTIERLQMAQNQFHVPVLASEIIELYASLEAGVVVDATLGGGGHTAALLAAAPQLRVLGIDRDPDARRAAGSRLESFGDRVRIAEATFAELGKVIDHHQDFLYGEPVVGVLMDLGVSSHQLDESTRGFSFRADAALDMRMDPTKGETAADLIKRIDRHDLARLLRANGESRFAGAIAKSIVDRHPQTTSELTEAVEWAVPMAARRRGHVATRVFQALRIAVNAEEEQLEQGVSAAIEALSSGGIVAVISYHSGEDRAVKSIFHEAATGGCHCPVELGCVCGAVPVVTVFKASAQLASATEIASNPRARSARLRIARKLPA